MKCMCCSLWMNTCDMQNVLTIGSLSRGLCKFSVVSVPLAGNCMSIFVE